MHIEEGVAPEGVGLSPEVLQFWRRIHDALPKSHHKSLFAIADPGECALWVNC
jgi:hypothetical protein